MTYDVCIIGGGIVGLATAYHLQKKMPELRIVLLEKESETALHQTGHNSGVIHSGIYYKPGSLKAKNCIDGYHMLLDFCEEQNLPYDKCGKVIVATTEKEIPILQGIYERGEQNGLQGLQWLEKEAIKEREPHVAGIKGIFVPQTGIIDYTLVSRTYASVFESMGGEVKTKHKVLKIDKRSEEIIIQTTNGEITSKMLINCAGLYSDKIAGLTEDELDVRIIPFRGEYYELKPEARQLVKNLIYPVPDPNFPFLGVHFTRMINGHIEAGPNAVFAFKREGYRKTDFNAREFWEAITWPGFQKVMLKYWKTGLGEMVRSFSKQAFTNALQKLIPEIQKEHLETAPSGVRAQACDRTGGLLDDFKIVEKEGIIHVLNAPSPAATSSLSIGNTVSNMAIGQWKNR
jgi:L-2-hydroxyglutarate oxidase